MLQCNHEDTENTAREMARCGVLNSVSGASRFIAEPQFNCPPHIFCYTHIGTLHRS